MPLLTEPPRVHRHRQAAADGHSTPGLCPGLGDEGCEYRNFSGGTHALCRQCQCSLPCLGLGDEGCPHGGFRDGAHALCRQCQCSGLKSRRESVARKAWPRRAGTPSSIAV